MNDMTGLFSGVRERIDAIRAAPIVKAASPEKRAEIDEVLNTTQALLLDTTGAFGDADFPEKVTALMLYISTKLQGLSDWYQDELTRREP